MSEYWVISVPEKIEGRDAITFIEESTQNLSNNYKIVIPQFKFGNIDDLIKFSEESGKMIINLEAVVTKIVHNISSLLDENEEILHTLQVNGTGVNNYLHSFHWDYLKYPTRKRPQMIVADICEQFTLICEKMKTKVSEFNTLKNEVEKIEAKHTGSLLARDLSDFVKKEDILLGSKFMQTVLILVPSIDIENWKTYYEHFWHGIVPGSSKLLYRDLDFGLFTVVVTTESIEGFKSWSLKSRIIVRKFEYNEDEIKMAKISEYKSKMQLTVNRRNLQFWLKKHYSLCFSMYFHIQLLRVMSESTLKYGILSLYSVLLIKPKNKNTPKIRKILDNIFSCLDELPSTPDKQQVVELSYTYPHCGSKDYFPYVSSTIHVAGCPMKTKVQLLESLTKTSS